MTCNKTFWKAYEIAYNSSLWHVWNAGMKNRGIEKNIGIGYEGRCKIED
jgi:hypothetical protein